MSIKTTLDSWRGRQTETEPANKYTLGDVYTGGSHHIATIFGIEARRSQIVFRNCEIIGPAIISLLACDVNKCDFLIMPTPFMLTHIDGDLLLLDFTKQFYKSTFDNCVFHQCVLYGKNILGPTVREYQIVPKRLG
jgi:hypothetical protein